MGIDLAGIVRQLRDVETQHPDTIETLEPIIEALSNPDESAIGTEQARQLLGVRSVNTVKRWIGLGILAGSWDDQAGRWRIPLRDVLRLQGMRRALIEAGGNDLSNVELESLSATQPGSLPWQRGTQR
jgi:hypothetical protein